MALYAAILAGGMGTRLWPASTAAHPKQFLAFNAEKSLLQQTVDRIALLIPADRTYILTFQQFVPLVSEQLPSIPRENIITEPVGCDTVGAIGLAATLISRRDPDAVMGSFSADIYFGDDARFCQALSFAESLALEGYLVAFGIRPTRPETNYGYIEFSDPFKQDAQGFEACSVVRYCEKPQREQAKTYIQTGKFLWNTGMFVWRADHIQKEIIAHVPELRPVLERLRHVGDLASVLHEWPQSNRNLTIEIGVVEKSQHLAVVPLSIDWSDLGTWLQIANLYQPDRAQNRIAVPDPNQCVAIDTSGTFVYATTQRRIVAIGLQNLMIIESAAGVLICHKDQTYLVREVVSRLPEN